ncbi:hypothetical protein REPUB_Repub11eG0088100 [Reevesia pubescens]
MITTSDLYYVLTAVVPLYVAMILAYGSVKWWKIFTLDQCSGINQFVALFAVPLISFHFISTTQSLCYELEVHSCRHSPKDHSLGSVSYLVKNQRQRFHGVVHHLIFAIHSSKHFCHGHSFVEGNVWRIFKELNGPNSGASMHNLVHVDALSL